MDQAQQFPVSWGPQFKPSVRSHRFTGWLRQTRHASARAKAMFMERGAYPQPSQAPDPRYRWYRGSKAPSVRGGLQWTYKLWPPADPHAPILEVLLLPPSRTARHLIKAASLSACCHSFCQHSYWVLNGCQLTCFALLHNCNWCGLPFCSAGDGAWSCGGPCGWSFFFCVSLS